MASFMPTIVARMCRMPIFPASPTLSRFLHHPSNYFFCIKHRFGVRRSSKGSVEVFDALADCLNEKNQDNDEQHNNRNESSLTAGKLPTCG